MSNGAKRIIRYSLYFGGKYIGAILLLTLAMIPYMTLLSGEWSVETLRENAVLLPTLSTFVGILIIVVVDMTTASIYANMELSMGATRRDVAFGSLFLQLMYLVACTAWSAVCSLISAAIEGSAIEIGTMLLGYGRTYLFATAAGMLSGILVKQFGKVAYYIMVFAAAIAGGVFGALFGVDPDLLKIMSGDHIALFFVLALAVFAAMAVLEFVCGRKRVVRL